MEVRKDILWRVYLSFLGVVLLSLVVLGRAFYIQRFEGKHWRSMSDSLHQKFVPLEAERGTIYSEDGQMLSTSVPYFDVYMDMQADGLREKSGKRFKENLDSFALSLAKLFPEKTAAEYKKELKHAFNEGNRYYSIHKALTFDQFKAFRGFPLVRLGRNKSGIITEVKSKRLNPFGMLARRTIGLSRDNAQNVGLERTYDSLLTGTKGKRLVRFLTGGMAIPVDGYEIEPEDGKDIVTTIDIQMQDIVESALMKMLVQSESQYGTAIVMEVKTGKIKAIANLGRNDDGSYTEKLNYALQTTEPGSTIKLATLLAVLDKGSSHLNELVHVGGTGSMYVGVRNVNDAERQPKPDETLLEVFAHSSNVGTSLVAYKAFANEPDTYKSYLKKFHLDKRTGIDLLGEDAPVLPKLTRNKEGLHAMITASFGYAIEVSPLHTAMLYNAVANGGKMMKPYLVSSIRSHGVVVKDIQPTVLEEQICKPKVIADARKAMEAVVTEGTAKEVFKNYPIAVAGKTGTAHVASGPVKYTDGVYQASFAGYFPANAPEYTIVVVIKTKPHAVAHFGGALAAPVFKEIATKLYAQYVQGRDRKALQLVPDSASYRFGGYTPDIRQVLSRVGVRPADSTQAAEWSRIYPVNHRPVLKGARVERNTMPDVTNMTLKDAVFLLEQLEMKVVVRGRGRVVAQDIQPGTPINKKQTITILLNQ